ncbi:MAG TPA: PAS domain-containing protein, partial [Ignavibacteriales bacterium]|nr:PAS domain-containing protein [Ignavibacteriales bacterium]
MSLRRPTITAKKLVGTFFLLCIGIILAGMLFYFQLSDRIKYKTHQELKAVSNLKVEQIRKWKSERLAEGIFMQENKTFSRLAERYFSQRRDSSSLKEMVDWLNIIRLNHLYEIIDIIDKDGHIVYRLGDNDYKWKSFMLSYFSDKKKDAGISFSKLHRDSHGHAHIDMIIPIFTSPENKTGSIIAYISFRLNPEADLFPIIQNWPTNSYSSESILLLRDGDSVVFINSLRHFKNSPLNFRMPVNKPNLPAAAAARGYQGFMEGIDYRGREVMAYIQKVNGSDWYMVAKTDSDEVLSGLRTGGILTLMLVLVLMITSGLSLVTVWNRHRLESMRKLVEAEAQQKVLLKHFEYLTLHANDIILLTNESGNIIEANARAEKAYEYSRSQLIGKNISSVFSNDTMRLLQLSNSDQGLVYEGQNIKHDGSMFPVEISSRSMVY